MTSLQRFSPQNRRFRKLPPVVRRNRRIRPSSPSTPFYTYQNALLWVRSQKDVIIRLFQLLHTYPNLIQDESMDKFWEFLEPLLPEDKESRSRETSSDMDTSDTSSQSLRLMGHQVPQNASTTLGKGLDQCEDIMRRASLEKEYDIIPRLHIISHCDEESVDKDAFVHRTVIGALQGDFFVRVPKTNAASSSVSPGSDRQLPMFESDICLYLFTNSTLENPNCFHNLCIAISNSIPVLYVKTKTQTLPDNFSTIVMRSSGGCSTVKEYLDNHLGHFPKGSPVKTKPRDKVTNLMKRPSSARESSKEGRDWRRGKRRHSPVSFDNELTRTLINGFNQACVIGESDIQNGFDQLKQVIYKNLCDFSNRPDLYVGNSFKSYANVNAHTHHYSNSAFPQTISMHNKFKDYSPSGERQTLGNSFQTFTDDNDPHECGPLFRNSVRTIKLPPLEQQSTTYLLFDRNTEGPKRVEYPFTKLPEFLIDSDLESEDMEPVQSPIQFHEIDLSRQVNGRMTPESEHSCSSLY